MSNSDKRKKRKGRWIPAFLCRLLGTAILLIVIAVTASIVIPQIRGIDVYHIISGSMEPEIPVGSAVYINTRIPPEDIKEKDVIAFASGESTVVHRVTRNQVVEGYFNTRGDANDEEDFNDIGYNQYIGKVVNHIPYVGEIMMIFTTSIGKVYVLCFALSGALLNLLAGRLSRARREERDEEVEE
ncbi:MAG: signal peptidase I [Eubacterium sp.]|nr:signal peptidase I [Eubacterium sp.]